MLELVIYLTILLSYKIYSQYIHNHLNINVHLIIHRNNTRCVSTNILIIHMAFHSTLHPNKFINNINDTGIIVIV